MDELLQGAIAANKERDLVRLERCLRESLELVLGWRTNEYLKSGKLDVALDHANALIEMYPNSPVGYISAGDVYCEKCDYKRAVDIYAEGLAKSNQRSTAEIAQRVESTKLLRDKKCDPLIYLPGELIAKIFDYVPEKRVLCTRLSRTWRQRLPLLPMWSTLRVDIQLRRPGYWHNGLVRVLKPSLREIHIETDSELCPILSLMSQAGCDNVRKAGTSMKLFLEQI
ncbi:hypothetical protein BCR43DRAFT_349374 [Syncephalastrum racemosum]|uniref:Uncharacterized protein n=1 Tax=Syncephalastrum racemosum TaxID=13706 RepID=A0A1X2H616_SYNRA|nr:hypothetical protein BCR43DRAFT_349374 [Syncephalastrum racemosum]